MKLEEISPASRWKSAEAIRTRWNMVGIQWRLHLFLQASLAVFFFLSQGWLISQFEAQGIRDAEAHAVEVADGLINGLNILMVTGRISDPKNRQSLVQKMSSSMHIKQLRVIRSDQVSAQFGPGMPDERSHDDEVLRVFASGIPSFSRTTALDGGHTLRAIIPFVASENFRGTNCLSCHRVQAGSVNGVADISLDLSTHDAHLSNIKQWMWSGMLLFQFGLSGLIAAFINVLLKRHILRPLKQLQSKMEEIHNRGDLSLRAAVNGNHQEIDNMAITFNQFVADLETATEEIRLLAKVVESSEESILITDARKNIIFVNQAFSTVTGFHPSEVLGENPRLLKSNRQDSYFYSAMWAQLHATGSWKGEIYNRRKNGDIYPEWQSICVLKNKRGEITNYVSIFLDISKLKESEERIHRMANFDALTGLPNRNLFNDRLTHSLRHAKRNEKKCAVMYLDLDNFKYVNDCYGHSAGDALLKDVSQRLLACVREGDTASRHGGDEFILLLSDLNEAKDAASVADKLLRSVAAPFLIEGHEMFVSVSIGIAVYPEDGLDMEHLLKHADSAMYSAKQEGRNCSRFFSQAMIEASIRRMRLQAKLRDALRNDEFELNFQPQLNVTTGAITGVEALLRWCDKEWGYVTPGEFIPVAEDSGLIIPIGKWVLQVACMEGRRLHDNGHKVMMSVNVSGRQLKESDFSASVEEALSTSGLDPQYLELEITEGVLIEHNYSLSITLNRLRSMGLKLAMDDFGTGYSSLSYIKRFPISRIKIDQSFVRDVLSDSEDAAIVDAIIYIAQNLKISVIAEGVETVDQLEFLRHHHCFDIQGYFISRPVSSEKLDEFLSSFPIVDGIYGCAEPSFSEPVSHGH